MRDALAPIKDSMRGRFLAIIRISVFTIWLSNLCSIQATRKLGEKACCSGIVHRSLHANKLSHLDLRHSRMLQLDCPINWRCDQLSSLLLESMTPFPVASQTF